ASAPWAVLIPASRHGIVSVGSGTPDVDEGIRNLTVGSDLVMSGTAVKEKKEKSSEPRYFLVIPRSTVFTAARDYFPEPEKEDNMPPSNTSASATGTSQARKTDSTNGAIKSRTELKAFFGNGRLPDQSAFAYLIDSLVHQNDLWAKSATGSNGTNGS